jgi:hypothetical protein
MRKKKVIPKLSEAMIAGAKKTKPMKNWMRAEDGKVETACALGAALVEVDEPYIKKRIDDHALDTVGFASRIAKYWPFMSKPHPEAAKAIRPAMPGSYLSKTSLRDVVIHANDHDGESRNTIAAALAKFGL